MTLTDHQNDALTRIIDFANDKNTSVFILKGYAGTGKTTMIKAVIPEIEKAGRKVTLMAPTGRAAHVLREKTGHGTSTIHRGIYAFADMQAVRHDEKGNLIPTNHTRNKTIRSQSSDDLQFWYVIKQLDINDDPSKYLYIIDESSMISSVPARNETFHFGTDILLNDLLTYAQLHLGGKILFVGDPAQLPPVGDNRSAALDEEFFLKRNISVASFELTEVLRQNGESTILKNAMMIRDLLETTTPNNLVFERNEGEVEDMLPEQVVESFYEHTPSPQIDDSIIICYTNALALDYNQTLRRRYFPGNEHVMPGDILQVVKNNVNERLEIEYYNGDLVRVLDVSDTAEPQSAPVWTDKDGKRQRVIITLLFRDAVLQSKDGSQTRCKIIDDLLNTREPNLTPLQHVALYINFRMRHPGLRPDEEAFKEALMEDPYYNAVQVKYGYAITGHKSQGGEWSTAYVDYSGRNGLNRDSLRWAYTATTRAGRTLYGVNMPNITPLSKLKIGSITKYSKPAGEAFAFADIQSPALLPSTATAAQKQKCLSVKENLEDKGLFLKAIRCCQYNDKYTIETPSGSVTIDCYYNASGLYTRYTPNATLPEKDEIMAAFNDESNIQYAPSYTPSSEAFKTLYNKMLSLCDDLDIQITNIAEHPQQYYISYYLKTSGRFAQILFYFTKSMAISQALPSSDIGKDDEKLNLLIQALQ